MSTGVLLVAHGSHLHIDSSEPTWAHARRLRDSGRYDEVRVSFWKEEPSLARGLDAFAAHNEPQVDATVAAAGAAPRHAMATE